MTGVIRRAPRVPSAERIQALLEAAADEWFRLHGDQFAEDADGYSSAGNLFLHAAEDAYFKGDRAFRGQP